MSIELDYGVTTTATGALIDTATGAELHGPTIHTFDDTSAAYDATQCDDSISKGHLLVIADEGVIGIAETWPWAVTAASGALHKLKPGATLAVVAKGLHLSESDTLSALRAAMDLADEKGFPVDPTITALVIAS